MCSHSLKVDSKQTVCSINSTKRRKPSEPSTSGLIADWKKRVAGSGKQALIKSTKKEITENSEALEDEVKGEFDVDEPLEILETICSSKPSTVRVRDGGIQVRGSVTAWPLH